MSKSEREAKELQRRRLRAGRLLQRGVPQAEVARRVSVTRTTVSQWNAQLEAGGMEALKSRPRGRPSGLDEAQRRELMRALTAGALAEGFATDLWTLPRVGELIKRRFTRSYSESQVWRILVLSASLASDLLGARSNATRARSSAGSKRAGRL